jgi:hypothetical protein
VLAEGDGRGRKRMEAKGGTGLTTYSARQGMK